MIIKSYTKCQCGAITLEVDNGYEYSCNQKNLKKFFPQIDLRRKSVIRYQDTYCCDYCVNHYGLDLCGCGSGELFGKCDNNLEECKQPMQSLGEYTCVIGASSLNAQPFFGG